MKIIEKKLDDVSFITLDNEKGLVVVLSTLGASIYQLETIDKYDRLESVILTPTALNDFYVDTGYYGKSVGRFSGRIDKAQCSIDNQVYNLDINWNKVNSLHGGYKGISFQNFAYEIKEHEDCVDVIFSYLEKENQLPGDVHYKFTYKVYKSHNEIKEVFNATTTKKTIVNLTNHTYFNLSGNAKEDILNQKLYLNCDKYTKLNNDLITTSIEKVDKIMDFTKAHKIGKYIEDDSLQNHMAKGYDHCFIKKDSEKEIVAILKDDKSHRQLTVRSSYPAIVCYTCNYPASFYFNTNKIKIHKHHSICLEAQFIPNGINMSDDNHKALLNPDETYEQYISYTFEIR